MAALDARNRRGSREEDLAAHDDSVAHEGVAAIGGREWLVAAVLLSIGLALRVLFLDRLAIEHFDEGVYASNLWFGAGDGQAYPLRHLYAPPLLPGLIELCLLLGGVDGAAPFAPSLAAGVALVPSIWWIGRRWFGPRAGLAAAGLAAASDVHATFSRMALTDSLLLLWLVWGVFAAGEMLRKHDARWYVVAVFAAGAAWWTKYNGWLAWAIPAAAAVLQALASATARRDAARSAAWLAALILGAFLLWAPIPWSLQGRGGYAAVNANHARYLTGVARWPATALRQLENLRALESAPLAVLAPWIACGAAWWGGVPRRNVSRAPNASDASRRRWLPIAALAAWSATNWLAGSAAACGALALVALATTAWRTRPRIRPASLPVCLLAVGCVGLTLATPLYHPYARLALPWLAFTWLAAGWFVAAWLGEAPSDPSPSNSAPGAAPEESPEAPTTPRSTDAPPAHGIATAWAPSLGGLTLAGLMALFGGGLPPRSTAPIAWESRTSTRAAARRIAADFALLDASSPTVVLTYGEPALFFELRVAGVRDVAPVGDLDAARAIARRAPVPVLLAAGPQSSDDAAVREFRESSEFAARVARYPAALSTAAGLDRRDPARLASETEPATEFWVVPLP